MSSIVDDIIKFDYKALSEEERHQLIDGYIASLEKQLFTTSLDEAMNSVMGNQYVTDDRGQVIKGQNDRPVTYEMKRTMLKQALRKLIEFRDMLPPVVQENGVSPVPVPQ